MSNWREVPGFNYEISLEENEILCRSIKTGRVLKNAPRKGHNLNRIYWGLFKDGKQIIQQAARWIALTFPELVENDYFDGAQIDHKDTNRMNNHPSNLRWVTPKENQNNPLTKTHMYTASKTKKPVLQYSKDGNLIKEYPSICEAARETGLALQNISAVCNKKNGLKQTGGYYWEFK